MHPHLQRQLEQLGLAGETPPPTAEEWQLFLEQVSSSYDDGAPSQQRLQQHDLTHSRQSHDDYPIASKVGADTVGRIWSFRDVTDRQKVAQSWQYQVEFAQLIVSLSTDLIRQPGSEIDQSIDRILESIATFIGFDSSYIYLLSPDKTRANKTYEWCADGIEQIKKNSSDRQIDIAQIPWIAQKLDRAECLHVPEIGKLSPAARAEIAYLTGKNPAEFLTDSPSQTATDSTDSIADSPKTKLNQPQKNPQSLIIIPLICSKNLVGFLGFDSCKQAADR
ncbi:hypothetical protein C7B67_18015, partial [filamentous cyanobacterium Phorm 6]